MLHNTLLETHIAIILRNIFTPWINWFILYYCKIKYFIFFFFLLNFNNFIFIRISFFNIKFNLNFHIIFNNLNNFWGWRRWSRACCSSSVA